VKVGIVGSGFVGSTAAYAMVMQGVGREIVLVDKDLNRAKAEAADISHAVPFAHPLKVSAGNFSDLEGATAVIIAAGVNQQPGESRANLLHSNSAIFEEIVPKILACAPDAVIVVATNPVDIMTHIVARYAAANDFPAGRVMGSGTMLDSARFRSLLGGHLGVDPQYINGYVLGEHGESEVLAWSQVTVGGMPLDDFCQLRGFVLDDYKRKQTEHDVRVAANSIIAGKSATYYGIGSALSRIVDVIINDQRAILTVCTPLPESWGGPDVTASLPNLIGGEGVLSTFLPALAEDEEAAFLASATVISSAVADLDKYNYEFGKIKTS